MTFGLGYLVMKFMRDGWMVLAPKGDYCQRLQPLIWNDPRGVYAMKDSARKEARKANNRVTTWVWEVRVDEDGKIQLYQPISVYPGRAKLEDGDAHGLAIQKADEFWADVLRIGGEYELRQVVSFLKTRLIKYLLGHERA